MKRMGLCLYYSLSKGATVYRYTTIEMVSNQMGVGVDIFVRITLIGQLADIFTRMIAAELQEIQTKKTVPASS